MSSAWSGFSDAYHFRRSAVKKSASPIIGSPRSTTSKSLAAASCVLAAACQVLAANRGAVRQPWESRVEVRRPVVQPLQLSEPQNRAGGDGGGNRVRSLVGEQLLGIEHLRTARLAGVCQRGGVAVPQEQVGCVVAQMDLHPAGAILATGEHELGVGGRSGRNGHVVNGAARLDQLGDERHRAAMDDELHDAPAFEGADRQVRPGRLEADVAGDRDYPRTGETWPLTAGRRRHTERDAPEALGAE